MKRRDFLGGLVAAGLLGAVQTVEASPLVRAVRKTGSAGKIPGKRKGSGSVGRYDDDLIVFLSDTHLDPYGHQQEFLRRTISEILAMDPLPRNVIVLGDLAHQKGLLEDYQSLKLLLDPIEKAGITLTLAMGNHDRREEFAEVFPEHAAKSLLKDRYVQIVRTPKADVIVLDSLDQIVEKGKYVTEGKLDDNQREWLGKTLASCEKPVFVCAHHHYEELDIMKLMTECECCRGYIHGHNHRWRKEWIKCDRTIPSLGLPSTGQWGDIGYSVFRLYDEKAVMTLHHQDFFYKKTREDTPTQWALYSEDLDGATCSFSLRG